LFEKRNSARRQDKNLESLLGATFCQSLTPYFSATNDLNMLADFRNTLSARNHILVSGLTVVMAINFRQIPFGEKLDVFGTEFSGLKEKQLERPIFIEPY